VVRTVAEKLAGKAAVIQINTQDNPVLASRFAVQGIPLIVLLRNGRIVAQRAGASGVEELLVWFRQHT